MDEAATSLISQISYARNAGLDPYKEYPDKIVLCDTDVKFAPLYKGYENLKHSENKIDFDDMLILTLQLFKQNPVALYRYQSLYDYIIIDEFQDTNKIQANIFYQLSALHGNMCVVGDDDQSIYGFRSADSSIMLNFKKKFKDAQKFTLSTNYRSGKKIVEYAGKVINNNKTRFKKKFEAGREEPGELKMGIYSDELEENLAIIHWIKDLHDKKEVPYCNIAMLYRRNVEATTILPLLKKADIPISIKENPGNIHNHFVFEAINAYYQLSQAYDPEEDRISDGAKVYLAKILNCPSRYIKTEFFKDCDLSPKSIKKCINAYFETTPYNVRRYRDMLNNLDELKETLSRIRRMSPKMFLKTIVNVDFEEWVKQSAEYRGLSYEMAKAVLHDIISEGNSFDTMEEWIDYIGDFQEFLDDCANNPDGVRLSTFHGAKGLESIFVIDNQIPLGIVGIVAGKISEYTGKPAFVLTKDTQSGFYKGSARSKSDDYGLAELLNLHGDLLVGFGGHKKAAGLTIKEENISVLKSRLEMNLPDVIFDDSIPYDIEVSEATFPFVASQILALEPFGEGNPTPIIRINMTVTEVKFLGKNKDTLKFCGNGYEAIMFHATDKISELPQNVTKIDLIGKVGVNVFKNKRTTQINVVDFEIIN